MSVTVHAEELRPCTRYVFLVLANTYMSVCGLEVWLAWELLHELYLRAYCSYEVMKAAPLSEAQNSQFSKKYLRKASKLDTIPPLAGPNASSLWPCSPKPFMVGNTVAQSESGRCNCDSRKTETLVRGVGG